MPLLGFGSLTRPTRKPFALRLKNEFNRFNFAVMSRPFTGIKGVDSEVWKAARLFCVEHELTMGDLVNSAIAAYLRSWQPVITRPRSRKAKPARPRRAECDHEPASHVLSAVAEAPEVEPIPPPRPGLFEDVAKQNREWEEALRQRRAGSDGGASR